MSNMVPEGRGQGMHGGHLWVATPPDGKLMLPLGLETGKVVGHCPFGRVFGEVHAAEGESFSSWRSSRTR